MIGVSIDEAGFKELVGQVVVETLKSHETIGRAFGDRLAVDESTAASMLGLNAWQLRDLRRAGKISHSRIVGRRIRYTSENLLAYLSENEIRSLPPSAREDARR